MPTPSPTATGAGCLQPQSVDALTLSPESGAPGSTASVVIAWSSTAATDCADSRAQIRVNGEPASDPIPISGTETRVEVDIPEDVEGDVPVSLVSLGSDGKVLASSQFTVEDGGPAEGVSSWLLVAAGVIATIAAIAAQRLYSRRRARYGRQ